MEKKGFADRVWDLFSSVKLAIVVFSLIGLTSIIGTVLEQNAPKEKNMEVISRIFGEGAAPALYNIFESLGFMDMYRSWWFLALLMLFAMNLLVCSIDRFPGIWRLVRAPMRPLPADSFRNASIKAEVFLKGKPEAARQAVAEAMKAIGFKSPQLAEEGGAWQLFGQKTPWSRFGIYVAHFSIIIIMLGAVAGIFFGFKAFVNIPEGEGYNLVFARTGAASAEEFAERNRVLEVLDQAGGDLASVARASSMSLSELKKRLMRMGIVPLDFTVRCEDFEVEMYPRSDAPKAYKSLLTIIENGVPVASKWIEVNDPLRYKGVTFYQSSYGLMENLSRGVAVLRMKSPSGEASSARLKIGESAAMPGSGQTLTVVDFSPALAFDPSGRPYTYSGMMNNPAVRVQISGPAGNQMAWILKRYPETWRLPDGSVVEFMDFWGVSYTGLQARRDPGVWVVYLGCVTLALGLFVAFFMSHRKLWVRGVAEKGGVRVFVAATASKNRLAFERQIEKMTSLLGEGGKK